MDVERLDDAKRFVDSTTEWLIADEAANNLILGVSLGAASGLFETFTAWLVRDDSSLVAAAVRTPPNNLILARSDSADAIQAIADTSIDVPGVIGCLPEVDWYVGGRHGARRSFRQGIYQLTEVLAQVVHQPRRAVEADRSRLVEWTVAFLAETGQEGQGRDQLLHAIQRRLEGPVYDTGMWVLEVDGELVSMCGYGGRTPNGIRIGPVYTPIEHRGRGYASSLVAAQSRWHLDQGRSFCFLYTDLDDPTANSVYRRIGYQFVVEAAVYVLNR